MLRIGIVGGGLSAIFILKRIAESKLTGFAVSIFEKKAKPGKGRPYSPEGACAEHITNVTGNEIPDLVTSMKDWVGTNAKAADRYHLSVRNLMTTKYCRACFLANIFPSSLICCSGNR